MLCALSTKHDYVIFGSFSTPVSPSSFQRMDFLIKTTTIVEIVNGANTIVIAGDNNNDNNSDFARLVNYCPFALVIICFVGNGTFLLPDKQWHKFFHTISRTILLHAQIQYTLYFNNKKGAVGFLSTALTWIVNCWWPSFEITLPLPKVYV